MQVIVRRLWRRPSPRVLLNPPVPLVADSQASRAAVGVADPPALRQQISITSERDLCLYSATQHYCVCIFTRAHESG